MKKKTNMEIEKINVDEEKENDRNVGDIKPEKKKKEKKRTMGGK